MDAPFLRAGVFVAKALEFGFKFFVGHGGVPYSPNQRARREEQKLSLSIRNPIEGA